ncbi:Uncharacterised protein [Candidatus Burarchaeum australiense]|nr:Uncharacterised protein [Candidatus Burarchaeum australiense]
MAVPQATVQVSPSRNGAGELPAQPSRSLDALEASRRHLMRLHGREVELARFDMRLESAEGDWVRLSWYGVKGMNGIEGMQVLSAVTGDRFSYTIRMHATLGPEVTDIRLLLDDREIALHKSEKGGPQFYFQDLLPATRTGGETIFLGFHQIRNDSVMDFTFRDDRGERFMGDINLREAPVIYARDYARGQMGRPHGEQKDESRPRTGFADHGNDSTTLARKTEAMSGDFRRDYDSVCPVNLSSEQQLFAGQPLMIEPLTYLAQNAGVQMQYELAGTSASILSLTPVSVEEGLASNYLVPYGDDAVRKARALLAERDAERQAKVLRRFYDSLLQLWMLNQGANASAEARRAQERERELQKAMRNLQAELKQMTRFLPPGARARLEGSLDKLARKLEELGKRSGNEVLRKGGANGWLNCVAG